MKAAKVLIATLVLFIIGGLVIGVVGAGTPAGNVVVVLTLMAIFIAAKRLLRE